MKPFQKQKRIITDTEKQTLREQAITQVELAHRTTAEKEQLVAEGKLRRVVLHPDARTTIIRYEPINN